MTGTTTERPVLLSYARNEARDRALAEQLLQGLPGISEADLSDSTGREEDATWVLLLSQRAVESSWVNVELGYLMIRADDRAVRVVPVLIDDTDAARLPSFLRLAKWVDGRNMTPAELAETIRRALAEAA